MFIRAIDVIGNASLSLFLAMALLSLKLWQLTYLAGPVLIILLVQTLVMIGYAYRLPLELWVKTTMPPGVISGSPRLLVWCTPTAIANMQAVTDRYQPSHKPSDRTYGWRLLRGYRQRHCVANFH